MLSFSILIKAIFDAVFCSSSFSPCIINTRFGTLFSWMKPSYFYFARSAYFDFCNRFSIGFTSPELLTVTLMEIFVAVEASLASFTPSAKLKAMLDNSFLFPSTSCRAFCFLFFCNRLYQHHQASASPVPSSSNDAFARSRPVRSHTICW